MLIEVHEVHQTKWGATVHHTASVGDEVEAKVCIYEIPQYATWTFVLVSSLL